MSLKTRKEKEMQASLLNCIIFLDTFWDCSSNLKGLWWGYNIGKVMIMVAREASRDIISFSYEKTTIITDVQLFQGKSSQIPARFTAEVKN